MEEGNNKGSFERLVAGLSSEDRLAMLNSINHNSEENIQFVNTYEEKLEPDTTLHVKLQNESFLYKFFLWLRSVFTKSTVEKLYCDDILSSIAKKINHNHPGLINHKLKLIDYLFYERLQSLKDAADFFKPYMVVIDENPGEFYVFLSSFVTPVLTEQINQNADPFSLSFSVEPTMELRNELLHKLDDILMNMNPGIKNTIYSAITSVNWLRSFISLPYIHFLSQFTNVTSNLYTCPYRNAIVDFNIFASVFSNTCNVGNEILQAIYLFSQRKILNDPVMEKNLEKAVKEFMDKALTHFSSIQSFISDVPVTKMGRIINDNYDWSPENLPGVEGWFPSFRVQWKKIIDIRWNEWRKEQKKENLSESLKIDFGLSDFPVIAYRPWLKLWSNVSFNSELTGGFLSWLATEQYNRIIDTLNDVATEGIFYKAENRLEYSEGLNTFTRANKKMLELIDSLAPEGEIGAAFEEFSTTKVHNFQVQKQIDTMMEHIEKTIKDCLKFYGKGARTIERVFHGFFDDEKDGIHESLQNMNNIKGHDNRKFKDNLIEIRTILQKSLFYLSELEPIDNFVIPEN